MNFFKLIRVHADGMINLCLIKFNKVSKFILVKLLTTYLSFRIFVVTEKTFDGFWGSVITFFG